MRNGTLKYNIIILFKTIVRYVDSTYNNTVNDLKIVLNQWTFFNNEIITTFDISAQFEQFYCFEYCRM